MASNFTLRDFLVYFTTGALVFICAILIFNNEVLGLSSYFFLEYEFIREFSGLIIIFAIPTVYLIGHLIHSLGFLSLKMYKLIHLSLNKLNLRKNKPVEFMRIILHFFMYKNKIINSVIQEGSWEDPNAFWIDCAKLQIDNKFGPAEYWYTLNDLFKGLYTVFLLSTMLCLFFGKFLLAALFGILMLICLFRAIQYGKHFVITVKRLKSNL